ncbi:DUF4332 domain-containing protein [Hyphomonas sp. FCG-A18]|uniref:DUF4332 domain-containing protein n=1 Tax=Hyphomonas sp. FCG-A18 TaxID=3080019 RepID=UPI002B304BC4|nr:DUF4332 domain-containing protein [Hyphomonas sp. FCG-A18]
MTLLEIVITAHRCRSTHHYIAFDALQLLGGKDGPKWKDLLLKHHTDLLKGAKAPDAEFKDFQNHVLHVQEGEWGGARDAAMEWYGKAVEALRSKNWKKAAYALGVLTHYYADPVQPFHTGQTEEEGAMHRALEWSIAKSRNTIKALIDARGYPVLEAGKESGFVADMVLAGAQYSNPHYQTFIDHYNLEAGVKVPEDGLDETLLNILADLISYATAGVALLFERAFEEAAVSPPAVDLDLPGYIAALDIPIRRLLKRMDDAKDRKTVEAMYAEFKETGKVIKTLPDDDKAIRKEHARQVLRIPLAELDAQPLKPLGTKHVPMETRPRPVDYVLKVVPVPVAEPIAAAPAPVEPEVEAVPETVEPVAEVTEMTQIVETPEAATETPEVIEVEETVEVVAETVPEAPPEPEIEPVIEAPIAEAVAEIVETTTPEPAKEAGGSRLTLASPVVDAPSIGPKTAKRLKPLGIETIGDLLSADPAETVKTLDVRYITLRTFYEWQDQTRLMIEVPGLRVLDSQILVGAGVRSAEALSKASAATVFRAASNFLNTPNGARVLWGAENTLVEQEVSDWIDQAKTAANG